MKHLLLAAACALPLPALSDPARVTAVEVAPGAEGWTFRVTLAHDDTGWDDYADGWRVEATDGTILGECPLLHPHVDEQPFTRALAGVAIPEELSEVVIRARTSVEGWSDETSAPVSLSR